jgi:hypothetical protein
MSQICLSITRIVMLMPLYMSDLNRKRAEGSENMADRSNVLAA